MPYQDASPAARTAPRQVRQLPCFPKRPKLSPTPRPPKNPETRLRSPQREHDSFIPTPRRCSQPGTPQPESISYEDQTREHGNNAVSVAQQQYIPEFNEVWSEAQHGQCGSYFGGGYGGRARGYDSGLETGR